VEATSRVFAVLSLFCLEIALEKVREKGALRLVEKLPVNTFRIDFIDALFPGALFVHLVRNGIDVARSIGKAANDGWWYTKNGYKWEVLVQYASHMGNGALVGLCTDNIAKGILEWRLSILAARARFIGSCRSRKAARDSL
jgi:hypothetical protein